MRAAGAFGMHRREWQRKHQLVLDERQWRDGRVCQNHFRAAVRVERRQLALVVREQNLGSLRHRPRKVVETALARERHAAVDFDRKRRSAGRIRAALDKQVRIGPKGETVNFEQALAVFKKEAGLDVPVRYGGPVGTPAPVTSEGEELPIGAWFQLYQDQDPNGGLLYVRDYGLLYAAKGTAPPDAPTLTEFWKQKPAATKGPKDMADPIKKPGK